MTRRIIPYSVQELSWIKAKRYLPRRQLHIEFCAHFCRTDVGFDHIRSLCKRNGWLTGRTGCFPKGHAPANKGKKMPHNAASAATQFKKGLLPHNTKHLGHESMTKDGYVKISVAEVNPHTGYERRYVHKHRHLWEQKNGTVPDGMRLKCLDGDKANTNPENWKAIPLALAPRLNGRFGRGYDQAAPELKPTIMAIAELEHLARMQKGEQK